MNPTQNPTRNLALTEIESTQPSSDQGHSLNVINSNTHTNGQMEIESIFGTMIRQVGMIGQMCRDNFTETRTRIEALEDKSNLVNDALQALVNKDQEVTDIVRNQVTFNEAASHALNWLKSTIEHQKLLNGRDKKKDEDWNQKISEEMRTYQTQY